MCLFFVDTNNDVYKSYSDLIDDLNIQKNIGKYIYENSTYDVFMRIIQSLLLGIEVELIDSDFSELEINNIGIEYDSLNRRTAIDDLKITSLEHLFSKIKENKDKWKLSLYTSGTTGRPKKIIHTFNSMNRTTRIGDKWLNDVWAYAYNPTHFAGLQVFFQAFLNKNSIINVFDINPNEINKLFNNYKITNISATPTFYRNFILFFKEPCQTVKRVTSGGERFDSNMGKYISKVFPNAKINNVYASTEAGTLFASKGDIFIIKDSMKENIQITEDGELLIHKNLLGYSDELNNTEWYSSGDIVKLISDDEFIFVSRKTEMINVGGYKVNPHEVEDEINQVEGVVDVIVKPRKNSVTGNIIMAEISLSNSVNKDCIERTIKEHLNKSLQPWKVPRIIKFVNNIDKTRTGKKVRK